MGRGNTIIRDDECNSVNTFYIDYYEHDDDFEECPMNKGGCDCICNDTFLDDVLGNIRYTIQPKIKDLLRSYDSVYKIDNDNVFDNRYMVIKIANNEHAMAIGCCPKYNDNGKIINKMIYTQQANKFMKELNRMYILYQRSCAWTSGKVSNNETKFY